MKSSHLQNITPEQRLEMAEKRRLTQEAKAAYAQANLKIDYADDGHWQDLAKEYGVRLPNRTSPGSELKYVKRILKKFDIDAREYCETCGVTTLKQLSELNPEHTARAMVGQMLEYVQEVVKSHE